MRVVVVCTGNVARSPALKILLAANRPDLQVESAGMGHGAVNGLLMRKHMREILAEAGYGPEAAAHRSRRWDAVDGVPDLAVGVAPVHMQRLAEAAPDVPRLLTRPAVKDPAYGDRGTYLVAWEQIMDAARWLAEVIPFGEDGSRE